MNHTIYKYPINPTQTTLRLPKGAQLLSVQVQHGQPCVWALVDTEQPLEDRPILVEGTGWLGIPARGRFIGTFQLENGQLVFHVFDQAGV